MLIYTHPMLYQVTNVQNLLKLKGIPTEIRNEFAGGGTGELAANETWVELWLVDDRDQIIAEQLILEMNASVEQEWFCGQCGEQNPGSFESCWQCQSAKPSE